MYLNLTFENIVLVRNTRNLYLYLSCRHRIRRCCCRKKVSNQLKERHKSEDVSQHVIVNSNLSPLYFLIYSGSRWTE